MPQAGIAQSLAADSATLADALGGPPLRLTMRGTTVAVLATAVPAEGGCAAQVSAHAPGKDRKWWRLFRWSDVAWTGSAPDGRMTVAFYEQEGRLPADQLVFAPADAASFRAALARVSAACRVAGGEAERVLASEPGPARSCYFAQVPQLHLYEDSASPAANRPRAALILFAREDPAAELQLFVEREGPDQAGGDGWDKPAVAFVYASPLLKDHRVAEAEFDLDGKRVAADHAIAAFGDTRVRIVMDSPRRPVSGAGQGSFSKRLAASEEATLTLLDRSGQPQAVLHYDTGAALAAGRKALKAANWSCAEASPAPAPAAVWQPVP